MLTIWDCLLLAFLWWIFSTKCFFIHLCSLDIVDNEHFPHRTLTDPRSLALHNTRLLAVGHNWFCLPSYCTCWVTWVPPLPKCFERLAAQWAPSFGGLALIHWLVEKIPHRFSVSRNGRSFPHRLGTCCTIVSRTASPATGEPICRVDLRWCWCWWWWWRWVTVTGPCLASHHLSDIVSACLADNATLVYLFWLSQHFPLSCCPVEKLLLVFLLGSSVNFVCLFVDWWSLYSDPTALYYILIALYFNFTAVYSDFTAIILTS